MNFSERVVTEFMGQGKLSEKDANVALQVYFELCEVKKYCDVDHAYSDDLNLLYFTAKKSKSETPSIFIPRSSKEDLTFKLMQTYSALCDDSKQQGVFLALVSSDSTCVFYQITNGLSEPTEINARHLKINKQEKIDADLRKNRRVIEEAALCGIPITIVREPKIETL